MTRERSDWEEDYEAEAEEAAQEDESASPRPTGTVVYLVLQCGWEYNDSYYENTSDGITLCAFRSRQKAIDHAYRLYQEGQLQHWEIVERTLEEGAG